MILLNNKECSWYDGMTVQDLLDSKGYIYKRIIVKINGKVIEQKNWSTTIINDKDTILAIHMMAGG